MKFSPEQYARALHEALLETKPAEHDKILDRFVAILKEKGDLGLYPEIDKAFRQQQLRHTGAAPAEITTARETKLSPALLETLNKVVGGKLEVKQKVDESLIGGVVVRSDELLLDASLKSELESLSEYLKH